MTQEVDWNWQIQNRPALGGVVVDNSPSTGPYSVAELTFLNADGIGTDSIGNISLFLASLSQQGTIGTAGNQQLQGALWICGNPGGSHHAIPTWSLKPSVVIQDNILAWYTSAEGSSSAPNAYISYSNSGIPFWELLVLGTLEIFGGSATTDVNIQNLNSGDRLLLVPSGQTTLLQANTAIELRLGNAGPTVQWSGTGSPVGYYLDINGQGLGLAHFSLNSAALIGQYGTTANGDTVSGGIITHIGGGGSGSVTMSGDVTGSSSSNQLTAIQSNPVSASSPGVGDYLEWNGSDWIPNHGTVSNSDGTLTISPTTGAVVASLNRGHSNTWTVAQLIALASGGGPCLTLTLPSTTGSWLQCGDPSTPNNIELFDGFGVGFLWIHQNTGGMLGDGDLEFSARGGPTVFIMDTNANGGVRSTQSFSAQGDCTLPGPGHKFSAFGVTFVFQQGHAAYTSGFVPNTSANPVFNESTWDGGLGGTAYTVNDLVRGLKNYGWLQA
jgi:hypothetical protein